MHALHRELYRSPSVDLETPLAVTVPLANIRTSVHLTKCPPGMGIKVARCDDEDFPFVGPVDSAVAPFPDINNGSGIFSFSATSTRFGLPNPNRSARLWEDEEKGERVIFLIS